MRFLWVVFFLAVQVSFAGAQSNTTAGEEITIELAPVLSSKPKRPDPAPQEPASLEDVVIDYFTPIQIGSDVIVGRTIGQVTTLSPEFAPIPGLDEAIWKDKHCKDCHSWSRADLCTQSKTYLAFSPSKLDEKQHPFGGAFRKVLRQWASGDCQ